MKTRSLYRQSGLNLIEILVAALILSVGLLSMAGLQVASLRSVQNATQKQQAAFMVHELLERMRSNRQAALDGHYNQTVSCGSTSLPIDCAGTTSCSPQQLATYDLYTIQCGDSTTTAIRSGAVDQLLEGAFAVSCPGASCTDGITIDMSWRELLVSDAAEGDSDSEETQVFNLTINSVI